MAGLMAAAGGLLLAGGLAWVGVQGLRGVPDSSGKMTPRGTAIACLVIAGVLAVASLAAPLLF